MYANKSYTALGLFHQISAFNNNFTTLNLYSDTVPTDSDYLTNGFVFANHSSSLLGSISLGTGAFSLTNPSTNKWRISLVTAPKTGACTRAGDVTYGVLFNNTASPFVTLIGSVGSDTSATIRLDKTTYALSETMIFNYFNFVVSRGTI